MVATVKVTLRRNLSSFGPFGPNTQGNRMHCKQRGNQYVRKRKVKDWRNQLRNWDKTCVIRARMYPCTLVRPLVRGGNRYRQPPLNDPDNAGARRRELWNNMMGARNQSCPKRFLSLIIFITISLTASKKYGQQTTLPPKWPMELNLKKWVAGSIVDQDKH